MLPLLTDSYGIFWVSLAAGLLGLLTGKTYSQIAKIFRSSQMLSDMPKAPGQVTILSLFYISLENFKGKGATYRIPAIKLTEFCAPCTEQIYLASCPSLHDILTLKKKKCTSHQQVVYKHLDFNKGTSRYCYELVS